LAPKTESKAAPPAVLNADPKVAPAAEPRVDPAKARKAEPKTVSKPGSNGKSQANSVTTEPASDADLDANAKADPDQAAGAAPRAEVPPLEPPPPPDHGDQADHAGSADEGKNRAQVLPDAPTSSPRPQMDHAGFAGADKDKDRASPDAATGSSCVQVVPVLLAPAQPVSEEPNAASATLPAAPRASALSAPTEQPAEPHASGVPAGHSKAPATSASANTPGNLQPPSEQPPAPVATFAQAPEQAAPPSKAPAQAQPGHSVSSDPDSAAPPQTTEPTSGGVAQSAPPVQDAAPAPANPIRGTFQAAASDRTARPVAVAGVGSPVVSTTDALSRLTAQAPVLRRAVEQQSVVLQAARGLATALKQGDGTITLSLQPPRLGQLKVHLTLQDTMVSARIEPTTAAARQLLIDSEHSLRAALEARGLSVERIEVDAAKPSPHAIDPAPTPEARSAKDDGLHSDHPGGDSAGPGHEGDKPGRGAESHAGEAGHGRTDASGPGEGLPAGVALGSAEVSYAIDGGGIYRLHLDALA
jgi:flagellar hook-length control protein FliK